MLGIKADPKSTRTDCVPDDLLDITAQFRRSLSDEFGAAIRGDIAFLGSSYFFIIIYLMIVLSRR